VFSYVSSAPDSHGQPMNTLRHASDALDVAAADKDHVFFDLSSRLSTVVQLVENLRC
jgi:hypothetical protein